MSGSTNGQAALQCYFNSETGLWEPVHVATQWAEAGFYNYGATLVYATPSDKKFRLLGYQITAPYGIVTSGSASIYQAFLSDGSVPSGGGVTMPFGLPVRVGTAAPSGGGPNTDTGWVPLGPHGWLSSAYGNYIYINSTVTLSGTSMRVLTAFTLEP